MLLNNRHYAVRCLTDETRKFVEGKDVITDDSRTGIFPVEAISGETEQIWVIGLSRSSLAFLDTQKNRRDLRFEVYVRDDPQFVFARWDFDLPKSSF